MNPGIESGRGSGSLMATQAYAALSLAGGSRKVVLLVSLAGLNLPEHICYIAGFID